MKATKTWKLGEWAKGGVITVQVQESSVKVIGKEWDFNAGSSRGSSQSGAKEFTSITVPVKHLNARNELLEFLEDLTSIGYARDIMEWIETKTEFEYESYF